MIRRLIVYWEVKSGGEVQVSANNVDLVADYKRRV